MPCPGAFPSAARSLKVHVERVFVAAFAVRQASRTTSARLPKKCASFRLHVLLAFTAFNGATRAMSVQKLISALSDVHIQIRGDKAMTTERAGPTAQIIQFHMRKRFTTGSQTERRAATVEPVSDSVVGDAWYHDAAICDSKRAGER
jgi:hypothetical protein